MPREYFLGLAATVSEGRIWCGERVPFGHGRPDFVEVSVWRLGDIDGEWKSEEGVKQALDMNGDVRMS